ncbi:hypothetical protein QIV89_14280 [Klebsiella variicola]|uniref:hypothetical protein n=1 Tax=Klebsiella variicola TaxID=244366 RepID=UPI002403A17F|nr:hypothetical protein [Klebsiella variicola]MDI0465777.1 hypothetical protein [Klebsiella variicola]
MFKSLNTDWLKLALLRVFQSGWTVVVLVGLSLTLCSFYGRQAFVVWWLTFSGALVIGLSIWLGNLPYRLRQQRNPASKWVCCASSLIWAFGAFLLAFAPVFATSPMVMLLNLLADLTVVILYAWLVRKEVINWIL